MGEWEDGRMAGWPDGSLIGSNHCGTAAAWRLSVAGITGATTGCTRAIIVATSWAVA